MIKRWRTLQDETVLKGRIFRYRQLVRESTTQDMRGDFDVLDFLDWVNIVALTEDNQVLFVRQYRQGIDDITLEVPGGAIHIGEDPKLAAIRELREETGHEAKSIEYVGVIQPNPAIQSNRCHIYLARDCIKVAEPELDPLEELEVSHFSLDDVREMIRDGEIQHSLVLNSLFLSGLLFS